jgi:hypothetical protein
MGRGRELGLIAPNPAPGGGFCFCFCCCCGGGVAEEERKRRSERREPGLYPSLIVNANGSKFRVWPLHRAAAAHGAWLSMDLVGGQRSKAEQRVGVKSSHELGCPSPHLEALQILVARFKMGTPHELAKRGRARREKG